MTHVNHQSGLHNRNNNRLNSLSSKKVLAIQKTRSYSRRGMELTLVIVIITALFFDFTNGFHDTANAIATTVATKAVSPKLAVFGAAVLNFLGAFVSLKVAATIAKGIVDSGAMSLHI